MSHKRPLGAIASLFTLLLTACDGQQATGGTTTPVARVKISSITFADPQLAECVLQARVAQNAIYVEELKALSCGWVARLEGLEQLTQLTQLLIENEPVETVDLSKLTQLEELRISANRLDLSHNTFLRILYLNVNSLVLPQSGKLETLNLFANPELKNWDFRQVAPQSPIRYPMSLDLSQEKNLTDLNLAGNFTALKLPQAGRLQRLNLVGAPVGQVDNLLKQTSLETLALPLSDQVTSLDLAGLKNLTSVNLTANGLKQLVLGQASAITEFTLLSENLERVNIEDLTWVQNINLYAPNLAQIKLGAHSQLYSLSLSTESLSELNLGGAPNLTYLTIGNNKLRALNLNEHLGLSSISIGKSNLEQLHIDKISLLRRFYLARSQLTSLTFYPGGAPADAQIIQAVGDKPIHLINNPFLTITRSVYPINELTQQKIPDARLLDCIKNSAKDDQALYSDELKNLICRGKDEKVYPSAAQWLKTGVENEYTKHYVFNTQGLELFENLRTIDLGGNFITHFELPPTIWLKSLILDGNLIQRAVYLNTQHLSLNNTPVQRVHLSALTKVFEAKSGISQIYLPLILPVDINYGEGETANLTYANYVSPIELTADNNSYIEQFKSDRLPMPNWQPRF